MVEAQAIYDSKVGCKYVVSIGDYDGVESYIKFGLEPPANWEREEAMEQEDFHIWRRQLIGDEMDEEQRRSEQQEVVRKDSAEAFSTHGAGHAHNLCSDDSVLCMLCMAAKDIDVSTRSHVEANGRECSCCGGGAKCLFVAPINNSRDVSLTPCSVQTGTNKLVGGSCWSFGKPREQFIDIFMKNRFEMQEQDGVNYGECQGSICNMTGTGWEALPYPVTIDS